MDSMTIRMAANVRCNDYKVYGIMVTKMPSAHLLAVGVRLCGGRREIVGRSSEVIIAVGKRTCGGRQKMCDSKFSQHKNGEL